jgi:choline dehydrogenase-like flavoprotein
MTETTSTLSLSAAEAAAAEALAAAILPAGTRVPGGGPQTVSRAVAMLATGGPRVVHGWARFMRGLNLAAVPWAGRPLSALDPDARERVMTRWQSHRIMRWPLLAAGFILKVAHFDDPDMYRIFGSVYGKGGAVEPAPWLRQVVREADVRDGEEIECDVVVVGTGAGGAVVGKELAERGLAVVFLEEGDLYRRDAFTGSAFEAHRRFYRPVFSLGNAVMPVLMGRLVGGSTAINTATCFRTPPWVLDGWCDELGTDELRPARMERHFDRVERELQVTVSDPRVIGAIAEVIARGCDALGWRHAPIPRNAPGCDGQGVCDFGCPTDARRSMNLSYVPAALQRGAVLYTGARAEEVRCEGGHAVGVHARTRHGGTLTVRARATILAGGTIPTADLLLRQRLPGLSGQLGRNLTLHPSTSAMALVPDRIEGYNRVPQGYHSDQFHRDGILLVGAGPSIDVGAAMVTVAGRELTAVMDHFDQIAGFGVVVRDATRNGRVRRGPWGRPLVTYNLTRADVARLQLGIARIAEIFFAAGADRVFPLTPRVPVLRGLDDVRRFKAMSLRARDFFCVSWHPVGTCRIGRTMHDGVVGFDHQVHGVPGLYVVDGSTIPGPPAVNSQLTIMAFADRAAERIGDRLE